MDNRPWILTAPIWFLLYASRKAFVYGLKLFYKGLLVIVLIIAVMMIANARSRKR